MQSTGEKIILLPALPELWKDGKVKGICARGGFVVDMEWKSGKVTSLTITARYNSSTKVHCNGKTIKINLKKGETKNYKV